MMEQSEVVDPYENKIPESDSNYFEGKYLSLLQQKKRFVRQFN